MMNSLWKRWADREARRADGKVCWRTLHVSDIGLSFRRKPLRKKYPMSPTRDWQ